MGVSSILRAIYTTAGGLAIAGRPWDGVTTIMTTGAAEFGTAAIVAPHPLAAEAGLAVLVQGGNALEAAVAVSAVLAVARPDLAGLGGDAAWLTVDAAGRVRVIEAIGARSVADPEEPDDVGAGAVRRVPGSVGAWSVALDMARAFGGRLPRTALLEDAIRLAAAGVPLAPVVAATLAGRHPALAAVPGFAALFAFDAQPIEAGALLVQSRLADTLGQIAHAGPDDVFRGEVGREIAADLERLGAPLDRGALRRHEARLREPLTLDHAAGTLLAPRMPDGARTLHALGLAARLGDRAPVEALAVALAAALAGAPSGEPPDLRSDALAVEAAALPRRGEVPDRRLVGDGLWFGVVDATGLAVGVALSPGLAFGSGLVLPATGILMGAGAVVPPALASAALLGRDGSRMLVGGGGAAAAQSLVQIADARLRGSSLEEAVEAPRFALGRQPGDEAPAIHAEAGFDDAALRRLGSLGFRVERDAPSALFGEAGALARGARGRVEAAIDPRGGAGTVTGL